MEAWPKTEYETCSWKRDLDALALVPKSRRRKITPTYQAALPAHIATANLSVPSALAQRIGEVTLAAARFDMLQSTRGYDLPALLLRSESSSSSQIENLTSSVRNVALAELSESTPHNARLIAANVAAMRTALTQEGPISVSSLCEVHRVLMGGNEAWGHIRTEQVWIGGTPYSPHGAAFVPPHARHVATYLEDLVAFMAREDIDPVVKTALAHAQFETIHPFEDGNGRTGRALVHQMLAHEEVLQHAALPVSAGLLHNTNGYLKAITCYQQGDPFPIIEQLVDALELALVIGARVASRADEVIDRWRATITERAGSAIHRLPGLLVAQPVVDANYVANGLEITPRAARSLVERACAYGILKRMGNARRGVFYQAPELIAIAEEASSMEGIRRLALT